VGPKFVTARVPLGYRLGMLAGYAEVGTTVNVLKTTMVPGGGKSTKKVLAISAKHIQGVATDCFI